MKREGVYTYQERSRPSPDKFGYNYDDGLNDVIAARDSNIACLRHQARNSNAGFDPPASQTLRNLRSDLIRRPDVWSENGVHMAIAANVLIPIGTADVCVIRSLLAHQCSSKLGMHRVGSRARIYSGMGGRHFPIFWE